MTPDSTTRITSRRALLLFVVVLALLMGVIGTTVAVFQNQKLHSDVRGEIQVELLLLGELSLDALLRNDYAAVDRLVQTWVQRHDYLMQITARMPNGFVLSDYRKDQVASDPLSLDQVVSFSNQPLMTLHAVGDYARREGGLTQIALQASAAAVFVVLLLGWVLWETLQRTAVRPLEAEISQRAIHEQNLQRRSAELEAVVQELEAFSYSVSHDLRTPLRAIDGYCRVLTEDYASVLDAVGQEHLARTRAAAQRMGSLIDDLLILARMSRQEMSLSEVDLSALAREELERLAKTTPGRTVTVTVADGVRVQADPVLMGVVLENLLGNAWKYTAKTGNAHIEFGMQRTTDSLVCFVRDNGVGFDMLYANKLFKPFQRLHADREIAGSGIGLATVARILARHAGRVWAEAEPGKGATFYFSLPVQLTPVTTPARSE